MKLSLGLSLATLAVRVSGHGGIFNYTIDGQNYPGNFPYIYESEQDVIQRRWWPDPIQDVNSPDLSCNRGWNSSIVRKPMAKHARVAAGSSIGATWDMSFACRSNIPVTYHDDTESWGPCDNYRTTWVHGLGPVLVYMAACNGPCTDVDTSKLSWFKISEASFDLDYSTEPRDGYPSKQWAQHDWARNSTTIVPKSLKAGYYMLRHEIIMIELDPPQFYPICSQVELRGEGETLPAEDYLVKFPGAYSAQDPGLVVAGTVYSPEFYRLTNYTIPGPKVWTEQEE